MKYLVLDSAKHFGIKSIKTIKKFFPEGELYVKLGENISGNPIKIISNITPDNFLEFLFWVDAVKKSGAKLKEIIIPFLSYARQDKPYSYGESASGEVICSILQNLKVPIIIYDIHSEELKSKFKFNYESFLPTLLKEMPEKNYLLISPDKGGIKRTKVIAEKLGAELAFIEKTRVGNKIFMNFSKDVSGRNILIVDDMISTGETLIKASEILHKNGAREINCIAAHGLFVGNAIERLQNSCINRIITSNSLNKKSVGKIKVVNIKNQLI